MNDRFLRNVSIRQINIIIVTLVVFIVFLIVWIYIYIPIESGLDGLSLELNAADNKIKNLEAVIPEDKNADSEIADLKIQYDRIIQKIPDSEEESIKQLSEFAQALDLEVISSQKQGKKWLLDENKRKVTVDGKLCEIVNVTMKLRGGFKATVEFLSGLRQSVAAYVIVEKLKINNKLGENGKLSVVLDLNLFLLGDNEK